MALQLGVHLGFADAHEAVKDDVLSIHLRVGLERSLPVAFRMLQREQRALGTIDAGLELCRGPLVRRGRDESMLQDSAISDFDSFTHKIRSFLVVIG